ncbi:hypothetical protein ACGF07_31180 [Kitasatospora sp. NPDC048194]|uniref:hypothetical protein n=1 Tax=Kitasatospora sp. NPDC048194 TaxID=3364045 RepID=UPI0037100D49
MIHSPGPPPSHVPTDRQTAAEWTGRIAVLRATPPGWFFLLGRQSTDDHLCRLDLDYHLGRDFVAIVQTSRPVPDHFRVTSDTTPQSQLTNYLANSGRIDHRAMLAPLATTTSRGAIRVDGTAVPVEIHHSHGCRSAAVHRLPDQPGHLVVTAPDERWAAVTDLALRPPAAR